MAVNDYQIIKGAGEVRSYQVDDRDTSGVSNTFKAGEPLKKGGAGNNFVIRLADGDPEVSTDEMIGVCAAESTESATADGTVDVTTLKPGQTVIRGKATTATNIDTAAELRDVIGDWVAGDLTGDIHTIDENEGDDPNVQGFKILDGDTSTGTLDVLIHSMATEAGTDV